MSNKIKHFFEYLDYENLNAGDNSFERPVKKKNGIFLAMLKRPYTFYLPKSELCDMFQDSYGNNMINYIINLDLHSEIVQFLENFDSLCIANAANNSESWFGKNINTETLIKYYNTLYELSEDEKGLYLPILVENSNIEDIINYNQNDTNILSVKIVGIEFFQQTFRWQIKFNSIVDSVDESDDEDEVNFDVLVQGNLPVQELEKHFTSLESPRSIENEENSSIKSGDDDRYLETDINLVPDEYESDASKDNDSFNELEYNNEPTLDGEEYLDDESHSEAEIESQENIEIISNNTTSSIDYDKEEHVDIEDIDRELPSKTKENIILDKSIINELADEVPDRNLSNNILHNDTIQEIESIISEKRQTEKKYIINANRAQRAHDTLSHKATEVTKEIELYESKLRTCRQTN